MTAAESPLAATPAGWLEPARDTGQAQRVERPPRIMVIDDDSAHLQVVRIIITRESFSAELLLQNDPLEALAYLEHNPVDLVLLDVGMSGLDGFEVFSRIKASPLNRDVPVIFLSAYKETETVLRAFEMGAADFLTKPVISPILTARIQSILQTRHLQRELKLRNEALENINRLKDELLSICSHDLRSPLSAIDLICQFLREALEGKSKHSKTVLVNRIINQSRLARRLVDNLLDLNRIEEGMLLPTPSFFNLRDLLASCLEDEEPILRARELKLVQVLPPKDCLCFGDREMIAQVLRNVLGNAIKFTRSRVALECAWEQLEGPHGGRVRIAIRDDGPGIAPEELPALYDKYYRGDQRGRGLGLFISRRILDLHGGTIEARSTLGQGASFTVTLPYCFSERVLPTLTGQAGSRVLVLSASKSTALLLEGLLVEAGLLHVSKDWPPALASSPRPDLVVADAQAPLLPALTEAQALLPQARWIVLGSPQDLQSQARWLPAVRESLPLPVNPLDFLGVVRAALGGPALSAPRPAPIAPASPAPPNTAGRTG